MDGSEKPPCLHMWDILVGNSNRRFDEVAEMSIPQTLPPGNLGPHWLHHQFGV